MKLSAFGWTNRSYGCGPWRPLADMIEVDLPDFGSAVSQIWLTLYCNGAAEMHRSVLALQERLPEAFSTGSTEFQPLDESPKTRFQRKKAELKVQYPSTRFTPDESTNYDYKTMVRADFEKAKSDIREALEWGFAKALKKADDFDQRAFLLWFDGWRGFEVAGDRPLYELWSAANEEQIRRRNAADPWSLLAVDWSRVHPRARLLLDRLEDWSGSDDFSPHGNDTGADIFREWSVYSRLTPEKAALRMGWAVSISEMKETMRREWLEIHIALAFGHIKRNGSCSSSLAAATCALLEKSRHEVDLISADHVKEWQRRSDRYVSILQQFVAPSAQDTK